VSWSQRSARPPGSGSRADPKMADQAFVAQRGEALADRVSAHCREAAHPQIHQVEDVDAELPQVLLDGREQLVGLGSPTISPVGACSGARPPPPWRDRRRPRCIGPAAASPQAQSRDRQRATQPEGAACGVARRRHHQFSDAPGRTGNRPSAQVRGLPRLDVVEVSVRAADLLRGWLHLRRAAQTPIRSNQVWSSPAIAKCARSAPGCQACGIKPLWSPPAARCADRAGRPRPRPGGGPGRSAA
jgi:hypothetical protein